MFAMGVTALLPLAWLEHQQGARLVVNGASLLAVSYAVVFASLLATLFYNRGVGLLGTASFADGDANGDFNVDRGDLSYWKGQFAGASAVAAAGAVPEPAAACLAICGVIMLGQRRQLIRAHR